MRPARIITAVVFAAAIAITGCAAHFTAANPPITPVVDAPTPTGLRPAPKLIPAPKQPVLADGRYDGFIQQVNTRGDYLVVDLVQVFHDQAAVDAAVADGQSRDTAQVLSTHVRNQNPRLRTLPLASDVRLDLRGGCEGPVSHQLAKLAAARDPVIPADERRRPHLLLHADGRWRCGAPCAGVCGDQRPPSSGLGCAP